LELRRSPRLALKDSVGEWEISDNVDETSEEEKKEVPDKVETLYKAPPMTGWKEILYDNSTHRSRKLKQKHEKTLHENMGCVNVFCLFPAEDDWKYHHLEEPVILAGKIARDFLDTVQLYPNMSNDFFQVNGFMDGKTFSEWAKREEKRKIEQMRRFKNVTERLTPVRRKELVEKWQDTQPDNKPPYLLIEHTKTQYKKIDTENQKKEILQ